MYSCFFVVEIPIVLKVICNTLRRRHQSLELWYVYQYIPQLEGYIPQLPYTACLPLRGLQSV